MKDNFIMCIDNAPLIDELSDEQAGKLIKALMHDTEPDFDDIATKIVYMSIKNQIDRFNQQYEAKKLKRSEAGKKGMHNRWGTITNYNKPYQTITNDNKAITSNNKDNLPVPVPDPVPVPVKEISPKGDIKKSRFAPPSLQDVQAYADEKGYTIDAEHFIDYYESNGWRVGKNPMKDWKAAVRNWSKNESRSQRQGVTAKGFNNFPQRKYDYDDLERRLSGF